MPMQDQGHFIKIIGENNGIINSLCRMYYQQKDDIKDCRQDVILQLWKAFPTFRGEAKVSTWIYRVALNTILSKIRKERREVREEPLPQYHELQDVAGSVASGDEIDEINFLIQYLSPENRAIMILCLEGYTQQEIAETLQMTPSNVGTRLNRIKNELRRNLKLINHENR